MAWTPYPDKNNDNPVTIPSGWVTCDGSQITEGIWIGQNTPDLNGSKRFLRGGIISDVLNMEDDTTSTKGLSAKSTSTASHNLDTQDYWYNGQHCPSSQDSGGNTGDLYCASETCSPDPICRTNRDVFGTITITSSTALNGATETKPKNMNVVWIMKIK